MEHTLQGSRRHEILKTVEFWLKNGQMVCAVLAIALCVTFDQSAKIDMHSNNEYYHYSVSLQFPFIYDPNVTVQFTPTLPVGKFKFEPLLFPSVISFVATAALALLLTIVKQVLEVVYYGSQGVKDYINVNFLITLGVTFVLLAATCLWLANLITLVKDLNSEIEILSEACANNDSNCESKHPKFLQCYFSTAFGILLLSGLVIECIKIFIKMVYTIPAQITLTHLVRNVELDYVERQ